MKVLHIVGGSLSNGAFKGANILHKALLNANIDSKILNDSLPEKNLTENNKIIFINNSFIKKIVNKIFIYLEKIIKSIYLHSPRETFTIGLFGFDLTKLSDYKDADLIHIHWLNQGFINIKSLSKINKPLIWTMRDMWAFTGGSHYEMDFEKYEKSSISTFMKNYKKKSYKGNFQFVAVSDWLKKKAKKSVVLNEHNILKIDNNIDLSEFNNISQREARDILNINTKKQIILYGAQNPQSKRKGWKIFIEALRKIDTSKYYLLIFGNFWSDKTLIDIGIEYKNLGYINDKNFLNATYSCADLFVASSIEDAWPKTFAEAMYCGTPVVCFKNTSLAEIVDHKIDGYIVEDFNAEKLKDGINWLSEEIKNENLDRKLPKQKILNFDSNVIAKKYINLYNEILS